MAIIPQAAIPKLVLPSAIDVKPPQFQYEQYEKEHKDWLASKKGESAWRTEQRRRWVVGCDGLSGIHYFYLTQVKIKDSDGNMIRPMWRDVDTTTLDTFLECLNDEIDFYVFKRREIGLSSIFGGLIPLWISIVYTGSTSLMTSADLTRVNDLLANKFVAQHTALEDWVQSKRKTYDTKKGHVKLGEIDEDGKETGNVAEVVCRQTSQDKKDITNLEGARAKYAFLDELFLHPYPEEVRGSVESCLMKGLARTGIMVAGGSAGSVSRLGLKQARAIWDSAVHGAVKCMFISGALGITEATIRDDKGKKISTENFCVNGWSDEARATAYIMWQRAILDLNPDKRQLNSFIKRYPITIDEVFQSDEVGVIPKDVADRIPEQELELRNNPRNLRTIKVINRDGIMSYVNDPKGAWLISEEPIANEIYIAGSDCIPSLSTKEESVLDPEDTDRSMHCTMIKRVSTNSYVAMYMRRTSNSDLIYEEVSDGQKLYNHCQNMIERNSAAVFVDRYGLDKNLKALAYQPTWIGAKGYKRGTVRGIFKDSHNTERIYNAGFSYFRENMQNVDFPRVLDQLRVFGTANTDVIDAIFMCEVFHRGMEISDGKRAQMAMEAKYTEVPVVEIIRGQRVVRYKKVMNPAHREAFDSAKGGIGGLKPLNGM
tara:strand:+ start:7486 stop:9453 length:1968 start_codon:yes stop_codon:yes gene_type:complete